MHVKILLVGDVVGRPGRRAVEALLPELRRIHQPVFTLINCENAAAGSGVTPKIVQGLLAAGADCLTSGDHIYRNKEVYQVIDREPRLLRPLNWSPEAPGRGYGLFTTAEGLTVGVINLIGRIFLPPADCPFHAAETALAELDAQAHILLVDFHAEATSEKVAMGWHLAGRVTALFGTHTHVQTADERILPAASSEGKEKSENSNPDTRNSKLEGGTAYLTDLGMTGPTDSVIGRDKQAAVRGFLTQTPQRLEVAQGDVILHGAVITADSHTGRALAIERVRVPME